MRASVPQPRSSRRSLWDQVRERVLLRAMRDLGPLRVERVALPGITVTLAVRHPTPAAVDPITQLPYWADI